jgi:creatinine amidohydrolase/Fe(II)-dependent formamide hydrolase-like protein
MSLPPPLPYFIAAMTFREIESAIKRKPALIVPLGSLEPCTECGALGAAALCCNALAGKLSETMNILLAPMMPFGNSIAYKAFPGCGTLSKRTFRAFVQDILQSWIFQGVLNFIIIDGNTGSARTLKDAVKLPLARHPRVRCSILNWHHLPEVRSLIAKQSEGPERDRSEYGILSMAAFLDHAYVGRTSTGKRENTRVSDAVYQKWQRTGADPEKFRKLFPDARTSANALAYSATFGETLFQSILGTFIKHVELDLKL